MAQRLFVIYNPGSSQAKAVEKEVLEPIRGLKGWMVGKFKVTSPSVDENAAELAKMLGDGDLVVAAGGDGTAAIAANGALLSGKDVTLGALGYGNSNDLARMLGVRRPVDFGGEYVGGVLEIVEKFQAGEVTEMYPLEVMVNWKHWRYVPCYVTLGLLAEAAAVMDDPRVRKKLRTGKRGAMFSLMTATFWYLKNYRKRKGEFFPEEANMNEVRMAPGVTDYLAVNGPTVARLMKVKGGGWWREPEGFGSATRRLGGFWKMVGFGLKSVFARIPLKETKGDVIEFMQASTVEIQAEGEYQRLEGVKQVEVRKMKRALKVVTRGQGR